MVHISRQNRMNHLIACGNDTDLFLLHIQIGLIEDLTVSIKHIDIVEKHDALIIKPLLVKNSQREYSIRFDAVRQVLFRTSDTDKNVKRSMLLTQHPYEIALAFTKGTERFLVLYTFHGYVLRHFRPSALIADDAGWDAVTAHPEMYHFLIGQDGDSFTPVR
ncbi:MAG: hypothetical protein WCL23_03475 [Candidatus Moraniibacteriota bacterium]